MILGIRNDDLEIEQVELASYFLAAQIIGIELQILDSRWSMFMVLPCMSILVTSYKKCLNFVERNLYLSCWGNFNLIKSDKERNVGQGDQKLMILFNDFIGRFHLRELFISCAKFTWSNKQKHPILVILDRILATDDWEDIFPKCYAWLKARVRSDHCPLILDSRKQGSPRPKYFFFQEQWMHSDGFHKMVSDKWSELRANFSDQTYCLDKWHECLQALRKFLKGWNLNLVGSQRENKISMTKRIQEIDSFAKSRLLDILEW